MFKSVIYKTVLSPYDALIVRNIYIDRESLSAKGRQNKVKRTALDDYFNRNGATIYLSKQDNSGIIRDKETVRNRNL